VFLPLIDPETTIKYFAQGQKKLSGILVQAMAYHTPMVIHSELVPSYAPYLTAPYVSYDNVGTFVDALRSIAQTLMPWQEQPAPRSIGANVSFPVTC
jgi:hypothetical protein